MVAKDYDRLARAVACPRCGAAPGDWCHGARPQTRTKHTHYARRSLAAETRRQAILNAYKDGLP